MAKLYFYYSAMNAGKTTKLLQSSFNYIERNMETILYTYKFDNRAGEAVIASRIGLSANAECFFDDFSFRELEYPLSLTYSMQFTALFFQQRKEISNVLQSTDGGRRRFSDTCAVRLRIHGHVSEGSHGNERAHDRASGGSCPECDPS